MEMFLKRSYKLIIKFDVIFEILKLSITINSFGDLVHVSYTPQFKHNNNQKASFNCAERCWMPYVPM